jgi:hypothetical protein
VALDDHATQAGGEGVTGILGPQDEPNELVERDLQLPWEALRARAEEGDLAVASEASGGALCIFKRLT